MLKRHAARHCARWRVPVGPLHMMALALFHRAHAQVQASKHKRLPSRLKPNTNSAGGGWQESPLRLLTPEAKKRRAEFIRNWNSRMHGLLLVEMERR
jgi:hypothetical protein